MPSGDKTDSVCHVSLSSLQFISLLFVCFLESSLKRWWAIPEKICLYPPKGTISIYRPSPPPAGPAANSVWLVFPPTFRRSFHLFPSDAHPAILLILLSTFGLSLASYPGRRTIATKERRGTHVPFCISQVPTRCRLPWLSTFCIRKITVSLILWPRILWGALEISTCIVRILIATCFCVSFSIWKMWICQSDLTSDFEKMRAKGISQIHHRLLLSDSLCLGLGI